MVFCFGGSTKFKGKVAKVAVELQKISKESEMSSLKLTEDCRTLIQKVHESWSSYFTKWESFAKYEDEIPENELLEKLSFKQKSGKKKMKKQILHRISKTMPLLSYKTKAKKLLIKKKFVSNNKSDIKSIEKCNDSNAENVRNTQNEELKTILKLVLFEFSKETKKKVEIFSTFPQIFPNTDSCKSLCNDSQLLSRNFLLLKDKPSNISLPDIDNKSAYFPRSLINYSQNVNKNLNPFALFLKSNELTQTERKLVNHRFFNFNFQNNLTLNQCLQANSSSQSLNERTQMILYKSTSAPLSTYENSKLRALEWNLAHKSLASTSRKINREYFIKKAFPKINIIQYGKRFGNLDSHKRTNSVTLSLENSNLVTPERKPPERKCFSENVLKRKRNHPSKLFFDDLVEDSESDDQNEKASVIICRKNKKLKKPEIKESEEYDSDDCENIFDRVKKF